jgi:PKD repeat protein
MRVRVDLSLIDPSVASVKSLDAPLPDTVLTLIKKHDEVRAAGNYTWFGKVKDRELSTVVLTVVDGFMFGHIDTAGETYYVEPEGEAYVINKADPSRVPPFQNDALAPDSVHVSAGPVRQKARLQPEAESSVVDLLGLYTSRMSQKYGAKLTALLQSRVDIANSAYKNSTIPLRLNLAATKLYTGSCAQEGVDIESALKCITSDGQVATERQACGADLVTLFREFPQGSNSCGIAWLMNSEWLNKFESMAFSVVEVGSARPGESCCPDTTLVHELGHNMGCAHDRDEGGYGAAVPGAYDYSYGYDVPGEFGTIMSYDGPRINYFSTPDMRYKGLPLGMGVGLPDSAFNVLTIENTRSIVSAFRAEFSADFSARPAKGKAPLVARFTDLSRGQITGWKWYFGDGKVSKARNPKHVYKKVGKFNVTLAISNPTGATSKTKTGYIVVNEKRPVADFKARPMKGGAPLKVTFKDTSTGRITSRMWYFGDKKISTKLNPSHIYRKAGTYVATLKVSNGAGFTTRSRTITVTSP